MILKHSYMMSMIVTGHPGVRFLYNGLSSVDVCLPEMFFNAVTTSGTSGLGIVYVVVATAIPTSHLFL